jgi:hypothetical protein
MKWLSGPIATSGDEFRSRRMSVVPLRLRPTTKT